MGNRSDFILKLSHWTRKELVLQRNTPHWKNTVLKEWVIGVSPLPTQWNLLGSQNREEVCGLLMGVLFVDCCIRNHPNPRGLKQHLITVVVCLGQEVRSSVAGQF